MFINLSKIDGLVHDEDTGADVEQTKPVTINTRAIRAFYARRDDKPGSRITFTDGGGFAVSETPDAISALLTA
jgi:hypothetical protein